MKDGQQAGFHSRAATVAQAFQLIRKRVAVTMFFLRVPGYHLRHQDLDHRMLTNEGKIIGVSPSLRNTECFLHALFGLKGIEIAVLPDVGIVVIGDAERSSSIVMPQSKGVDHIHGFRGFFPDLLFPATLDDQVLRKLFVKVSFACAGFMKTPDIPVANAAPSLAFRDFLF